VEVIVHVRIDPARDHDTVMRIDDAASPVIERPRTVNRSDGLPDDSNICPLRSVWRDNGATRDDHVVTLAYA
jgi:hypothetical protein